MFTISFVVIFAITHFLLEGFEVLLFVILRKSLLTNRNHTS